MALTSRNNVARRAPRETRWCRWGATQPHTGTLLARHISGGEFVCCETCWQTAQHFDSIQLVGPLPEQRTRRDLGMAA